MTNGPVSPIPVFIIDDDPVFLQVLPETLRLKMPGVCDDMHVGELCVSKDSADTVSCHCV